MPTKKPRVMITVHDPMTAPTIGVDKLAGVSADAAIRRYTAFVEQGARELERLLTRDEWNAIADANNGSADMLDYTEGGVSPLLMIWANVADTPGLGERWHVDVPELVAKLRAMSPHHGAALHAAVKWFWSHTQPGQIDHAYDEWWQPAFRQNAAN